jgi:glutamate carboxypeptidase
MPPLSLTDFADTTPQIVALLKRLVETESPSTNKAAVDGLGAILAAELTALGASVECEPKPNAGDLVIGRWNAGRAAPLVLLGHMDTVYDLGALARQPCEAREGQLTGPGTQDMKGGITLALTALRVLREQNRFPNRAVTFLLTSDEEIGSDASRAAIERESAGAGLVLCLEPALPDGSLKTWRKGVGDFEIIAKGRAAHAGANHQHGRNAIEELAHHILALQTLTDYAKGTTLNVGVVSGGSRANVVPDEARAVVDMRVLQPAEAERVEQWMRARKPVLEDTALEVRGGLNRPPMPRDALMEKTFKRAQAIGQQLGLTLTEGGTGGGSDANFVAPLNVPVLDGLGAIGDGMHSEHEFVWIDRLAERAALLAALLTEW